MKTASLARRAIYLCGPAFAVLGVALASGPAFAQPTEDISVVAPHTIEHKKLGRTSSGIPIEQISITHRVGFHDLDLSKQADVLLLNQRVETAAKTGCKELDELYPLDHLTPTNRICAKTAVEAAMPQVNAVVAAAKK